MQVHVQWLLVISHLGPCTEMALLRFCPTGIGTLCALMVLLVCFFVFNGGRTAKKTVFDWLFEHPSFIGISVYTQHVTA